MTTISWDTATTALAEWNANKPAGGGGVAREPLVDGKFYDASFIGVTSKRSKAGAPQLMFELEVEDRSVRTWTTFTTNGTTYALQDLLRLGINPDLAPDPVYDPDNDWYEIDTDLLAEMLTDLLEGEELWMLNENQESEQYGTQSRVKRFGVSAKAETADDTESSQPRKDRKKLAF